MQIVAIYCLEPVFLVIFGKDTANSASNAAGITQSGAIASFIVALMLRRQATVGTNNKAASLRQTQEIHVRRRQPQRL